MLSEEKVDFEPDVTPLLPDEPQDDNNELLSSRRRTKAVSIPVPSRIPNDTSTGKLEITGQIGKDYKINQTIDIGFRTPKPIVFISTDKPLYKAGQTVRIRALVMDNNLRPPKELKKGDIWIADPNRIRIAQWLNEPITGGLIHRELPLPEEPVLGTWTVHVKIDGEDNVRGFEAKEYVLPPFEVTITPPPYILQNADNATWTICAKYTYGKPVRGELVTKMSLSRYYWQKDIRVIENKTEINGCHDITLPVGELTKTDEYYSNRGVELKAEVTEEGTDTKMDSMTTVNPVTYAYTINRVDNDLNYFHPGLPLSVAMTVKTPDSKPLAGEHIKICMEANRRRWNDMHTVTDNVKVCKNYTSDQNGSLLFTIPPQNPNTMYINIEAEPSKYQPKPNDKRMTKPTANFKLSPWFSASGSHLQLKRYNKIDCTAFGPDVRVTQQFYLTSNEPGIKTVHYQVISRGNIVDHGSFEVNLQAEKALETNDDTYLPSYSSALCTGEDIQWENDIKESKYIGKFIHVMNLTDEVVPRLRLVLYAVTPNGEIVADSAWYNTDPCFDNQVEMKFAEEKQAPGAQATIQLTAEPQSLCSIGIVDKSVYLLDKGDLLTASKVSNHLFPLDTSSHTPPQQLTSDYTYCSKIKGKESGENYESAGYLDTMSAFASGGGIVLTDLPLETRPCKRATSSGCYSPPIYYSDYHQPVALGFKRPALSSASAGGQRGGFAGVSESADSPAVTVRTDFPDTWLFKLENVNDSGVLEMKQDMPDSITEWQGNAICLHPVKGFGISNPASIIAFQPFFASLTLPYSVVRNETVPVIMTVFNYLKDCLPIKVHLDQTEDFALYNGTSTKDMCVCGDQSVTTRFHINPGKIGQMNITVTAATSSNRDICGNLDVANDVERSDTITKPVVVEAEGFLKEETTNTFFCLEDVEGGTLKTEHLLKVPDDAVKDSARAYCSFTGDIMGPTLEGLDRLVRMPTGCGEQNMVSLVPNIVVLDYLNATNRLTEKIEQKAKNNINGGYMRQQRYRHTDGSFSAFGQSDKEGSIWLTAFVARSFASASRYINIDDASLGVSRTWILSQQADNGCFPMVGTLHNKAMKGGVGQDDGTTASLTAYILISMLESGDIINKTIVSNGLNCMAAKNNPSNYSLALFSYAAALANDDSAAVYLQKLLDNAETESTYTHWKDADKSIAVETASYAILTLLRLNRENDFQKAASIVRWLTEQRNPYGGFHSTQDTVVALQALGEYGARINRHKLDMGLSIKTDKIDDIYQLNEGNELLTQRINLKIEDDPETNVDIEASGAGCALVQTHLRYNLPTPEPNRDFELTVQTQKSEGHCQKAEIRICASYNQPNGSNMAIVEIKMVSGYVPVIKTVEELSQLTELEMRRYEFKENTLNLYFTTLTEKSKCFSFDVNQDIQVLDAKPASVKVYDYYNNDKALSVPYAIEETCA